jgi:hypothetical protein
MRVCRNTTAVVREDPPDTTLPVVLSVVALVVAGVALLMALSRRRT